MTDAPQGGAPPENEAATQVGKPGQRQDFDNRSDSNRTTTRLPAEAGSTFDHKRLREMAIAIMPRDELRRYIRKEPPWCQRIGHDVWFSLMMQRDPDPSEIRLLLDAHARGLARRERERKVAENEKALRDIARRLQRGEWVSPNEIREVLGEPGVK